MDAKTLLAGPVSTSKEQIRWRRVGSAPAKGTETIKQRITGAGGYETSKWGWGVRSSHGELSLAKAAGMGCVLERGRRPCLLKPPGTGLLCTSRVIRWSGQREAHTWNCCADGSSVSPALLGHHLRRARGRLPA